MNIFVFLGAPGSGKGTQAKRLSETKKYHHFSTGDMLRAAIRADAPLGKKAQGYIKKGELVPDDIMIGLIEDALSCLDNSSQVILDGFPRTVPQAEALDKKVSTTVNSAIFFDIPHSELIERLSGRRTCSQCGESYHIDFSPPKKPNLCDKCDGDLIHRPDDKVDVVKKRLEVFTKQNDGLLKYYGNRRNLNTINANKPIETVESELKQYLQ